MAEAHTNTTLAKRLANQMRMNTTGGNSPTAPHKVTVPDVPMMFMLTMNKAYAPGRALMSLRRAVKLNG
jgi:hypothetical protein